MKLFEMPHSCQTTCTTRSCSYLNRLGTLMPRSRRCDALTRPHVVRVTCNDEQIEWHEKDEIRWRNACCLHSNSPKRFTIASNSQQNVPAAVLLTTVLTRSVDPPPVVGYFLHKNRVTWPRLRQGRSFQSFDSTNTHPRLIFYSSTLFHPFCFFFFPPPFCECAVVEDISKRGISAPGILIQITTR